MQDCADGAKTCQRFCIFACAPKTIGEALEEVGMQKCWFCDEEESGFWSANNQTLLCPICKPVQAEHQARARMIHLPAWGESHWPVLRAKFYGPRFQVEPWLLVIHSGSRTAGVAEFFHETGFVKNKGKIIKVSAHVNSSKDGFKQGVPFNHVAWHCGGSRYRGQNRLNFCSIGIELPGPWDKDRGDEKEGICNCVENICNMMPSLKTVVRHSDIDPRKEDPGPGFKMKWLKFTGLKLLTPP
jgi:hypothetical protein